MTLSLRYGVSRSSVGWRERRRPAAAKVAADPDYREDAQD
jgi:hypothetical protein